MVTTKAVAAEMRKEAEPPPQVANVMVDVDIMMLNGRNVRMWQGGGMIMRGGGGFINPNTGDLMPQGTAVPPLDKPADKGAEPLDDPAPAKDKKADK
jgi:hypothetical protein